MSVIRSVATALPVAVILAAAILASKKNNDIFSVFTEGAAAGLQTVKHILPTLCGLLSAIAMLRASGALELLAGILRPLTEALSLPEACLPLFLLRPVSGSASLALAGDCIAAAGPDSFAGRVAAVLMASSETTFYTAAVYSAAAGKKPLWYTLPCALLGDLAAMILSVVSVKLFF